MGLGITEISSTHFFNTWKDIGLLYVLRTGFSYPWNLVVKENFFSKKVLFSYWELGKDLIVKNKRIDLLKRIVSHLPYREDVLLWPLCMFLKNRLVPVEEVFYKGIFLIRPKFLVLFGEKIFKYLFPKNLQSEEFTIDGLKIILLPAIEKMLPNNRKVKKLVWEKLKNLI